MSNVPATLTQQLSAKRQQLEQLQSADELQAIDSSVRELSEAAFIENCLTVGDIAPDFVLPNAEGEPVRLSEHLQKGPVVLSFFRGKWCPYCCLELKALQQNLDAITASGATLLAISPQTRQWTQATAGELELTFDLLCDEENMVARRFGLVYPLPMALRETLRRQEIDLPAINGEDSYELPLPATYVIGSDRKIRYAFVSTDFRERSEPELFLASLAK